MLTNNTDACTSSLSDYWCVFSGRLTHFTTYLIDLKTIIDLEATLYPKRGLRFYIFNYTAARFANVDQRTGVLTTINTEPIQSPVK